MLPITQFCGRPGVLDLGWGHPHPSALPVEEWASAYARALRLYRADALTYGHASGPGPLVEWLCSRLGGSGFAHPTPAELFVTAGASHALELVCSQLVRPGDVVLVDSPTYHLALRLFSDHTSHVMAAPVDAHGIEPDATAELIGRLRGEGRRVPLLYLVPVFNNPTGRSVSMARRAALAEMADRTGTVLVEDETYRELSYDAPPSPSPHVPGQNVIRIGSFAKTVAPGLRLGWLVGPAVIVARLADRGYVDSGGGVNHATALAMAQFGVANYDDHMDRNRAFYKSQRDCLVDALAAAVPTASFDRPAGGWYVWLRVPGYSAETLKSNAESHSVTFLTESRFTLRDGGDLPASGADDRIRLSFSQLNAGELAIAADLFGHSLTV